MLLIDDKNQIVDEQSVITGIRKLLWSAENGIQINGRMVKLRGGCIHHDNGILGACAPYAAELRKSPNFEGGDLMRFVPLTIQ